MRYSFVLTEACSMHMERYRSKANHANAQLQQKIDYVP